MKKILLATTVLVGTAGFASAEVTLSGDARMGVTYNEAAENEMAFNSRARVKFTLAGETDGGLSFGASFRADNAADDVGVVDTNPDPLVTTLAPIAFLGAESGNAGSVFVSGAFGKLSMGDTSSAAENAVGDLVGVGYVGNGDLNEMVYITTGDNEMALYEYSTGDFTVMASVGQPGTGTETTYSLAGAYATDAYSIALGYENNGTVDHIIGGASATFSGVTVEGIYGSASDLDFDQYGVGVSYTADALTVKAFYRAAKTGDVKADFVGLGADYDLGGGATLAGGVVDADGTTLADIGVKFSF